MKDFLAWVAVAVIAIALTAAFLLMSRDCTNSGGRLMRAPWGSWECVK